MLAPNTLQRHSITQFSSISLEYIMVSPTEVLWKMSFTEILNVALVSVGHLYGLKAKVPYSNLGTTTL